MERQSFAYESMGSHWQITLPGDTLSPQVFGELETEIRTASERFDATYSRFKRESLIWQLADTTGTFTVPQELTEILSWYYRLYEPSGRKLNPLIGHTISDLGYDDRYTLQKKEIIRNTPDLIESLEILDATHIKINQPCLIDIGALGKGFFVDHIADLLETHGITEYLVNGSGDIRYRGAEALITGLEDPEDSTLVIGTTQITHGSICASGRNRRAWGDVHHVIDPHTGTSTQGILATWAVAAHATLADGIASCLFFADPDALKTQFPFEYCVLYDDRSARISAGFPGKLFEN